MNSQIKVKILADSISTTNHRITTFEVEYPRYIHAEVMTHRMFSRNAASSRAVPIHKMAQSVTDNPAMPSTWGSNKPGMQGGDPISDSNIRMAKQVWLETANIAADASLELSSLGLHKQYANRVTEPFQMYKAVITATEYDNFFELRCHEDAQPEIRALAEQMRKALSTSTPEILHPGEAHVPYIRVTRENTIRRYFTGDTELSTQEAVMISASCCAQVSYRTLNTSKDKALDIYHKLITSTPIHGSPMEHQAYPINIVDTDILATSLKGTGITHMDTAGNYWSGNFKGWIQNRQLLGTA